MKMGAMFLNAWSSNFPTAEALKVGRAIWAEGLADLSIWQIGRGLKRCESRQGFPPTLGDFRRMAVGLPSRTEAIARVASGAVVDPLSLKIMQRIGSYDLRTLPTEDIERRAGRFYDDLYESTLANMAGDTEEWEPPVELDYKSTGTDSAGSTSPEDAAARIAEIRKSRTA